MRRGIWSEHCAHCNRRGAGEKRETGREGLTPSPRGRRGESSNEERVKDSRGGLASSFSRQTQGRRAGSQQRTCTSHLSQ